MIADEENEGVQQPQPAEEDEIQKKIEAAKEKKKVLAWPLKKNNLFFIRKSSFSTLAKTHNHQLQMRIR